MFNFLQNRKPCKLWNTSLSSHKRMRVKMANGTLVPLRKVFTSKTPWEGTWDNHILRSSELFLNKLMVVFVLDILL